jgi:hypothetical protein
MKTTTGLTNLLRSRVISVYALLVVFLYSPQANAGIVQWRNRVPASESNPDNIGSYTNTIETGNGGTTGYDNGLDVDLDTAIVPNDRFFVTYVNHNPKKVEYEFTQNLNPGESYTTHLSFEDNSGLGFHFLSNSIDVLQAQGNFTYDLKVDSDNGGNFDVFRNGSLAVGEITPWNQFIFPGQDHRNGWYYGELTITNRGPDYDHDGDADIDDLDALTMVGDLSSGVAVNSGNAKYDGNGDGLINTTDLYNWLADAATMNGFGSSYLVGDGNLDGDVDVFQFDGMGDAQILTSNLGTMSGGKWSYGDFNADDDIDVFQFDGNGDAQLLTSNLGSSNDVGNFTQDIGMGISSNGVPEPSSGLLAGMGVAFGVYATGWRRKKQ